LSDLRDVPLRRRYSSGRDDLSSDFFAPCLSVATRYDRSAGFFSSSLYMLIGVPIADFALRGGKIRLVCSPRLSPQDIEAMQAGYASRAAADALQRELDEYLSDPTGEAVTQLLATLIAYGTIEIKIAFRAGTAIFHDKVGIFEDALGDRVSFTGSANETWSAWSGDGNHEYFHAFTSWSHDAPRVEDDANYFEELWTGLEPDLVVEAFPLVVAERLEAFVDPEGPPAAEQRVRAAVEERPLRPPLRRHQEQALETWAAARHRGILEHATGSGKTITALTAIESAFGAGKRALVLVPSRALLRQWTAESRAFFGSGTRLLLAGAGNDEWRHGSVLRDFLAGAGRNMVIATMDTAASDEFVSRVEAVPDLLLVADEVHRIGSPTRRRTLVVDADWRMGLSATWEREGDPEGSRAIEDYFERVLAPPYTLANAIEDGHLCPYRYKVHAVALETDERDAWLALSARIGQLIAQSDGHLTEATKQLLIRRARIIKKAAQKVSEAVRIVRQNYTPGEAWLVYCEDSEQVAHLKAALAAAGLHSFEYHTQMEGDALTALDEFERAGGIMLSINCLDEGVDIPRISHALILASSSTRRQFIQRRGRVLRPHPSKHRAVVYDVIVSVAGFEDAEAATFVRTELARALEFYGSARDSEATRVMLEQLAADAGVALDDPHAAHGSEIEEDAEGDG
jgi:superfamily II DNA or RNA helicase